MLYLNVSVQNDVTLLEYSCIRIASETFYSKYSDQGGMNWKAEINL